VIIRPRPRPGIFEEQFWGHVGQHRLCLQNCSACGTWWYPPAAVCPACNRDTWQWTPIEGSGTLLSWATFARTYFPSVPAPYTVAVCQLDEGPILVADTTEQPQELRIGQRMALRYYQARDEHGGAFTLYGWGTAQEMTGHDEEAR
jgi:uncharacterized OB-fold protein